MSWWLWKVDEGKQPNAKACTKALDRFLCAETWPKARKVLEKYHTLLLTDTAITLLYARVNDYRETNDTDRIEHTLLCLHLLQEAQKLGIPATWERFQKRQRDELDDMLAQAISWPKTKPELYSAMQEMAQRIATTTDALQYLIQTVSKEHEEMASFLTPNHQRETSRTLWKWIEASISNLCRSSALLGGRTSARDSRRLG